MTPSTYELPRPEWRASSSISIYVVAALLSLALGVAYYPIEPSSLKFQALIALTASVVLLEVFHLKSAFANRRAILLYALTFLFILLCYVHRIYNPPVTEYADGKLANLVFSLIFFQLITPLPFLREKNGIILVYSITLFSLVFCFLNFTMPVASENLRYSAIGLSPTMMAKIVLVVGVFALTMDRNTLAKKVVLFTLLVVSIWSSVRTGSRGPVMMLALSYGALLYLKGGLSGFAKFAVYAPLIIVAVAVALQFMPAEIAGRFELDRLSIESHSGSGARVFLWDLALVGLQDSWTGYGLGNYSAATFIAAPHNVILEAAYELGIPLMILYGIIIFTPLFYLNKMARLDSPVLDFFIVLYLMMILLSLISGEMTLTSALMYVAGGFIWGFAANGRPRPQRP